MLRNSEHNLELAHDYEHTHTQLLVIMRHFNLERLSRYMGRKTEIRYLRVALCECCVFVPIVKLGGWCCAEAAAPHALTFSLTRCGPVSQGTAAQ